MSPQDELDAGAHLLGERRDLPLRGREHGGRELDARDGDPRLRDRTVTRPVPQPRLEDRALRLLRLLDVEPDVARDAGLVEVVESRVRALVGALPVEHGRGFQGTREGASRRAPPPADRTPARPLSRGRGR